MSFSVMHVEFGRNLYGGAKQVTYLLNALGSISQINSYLVCPENSEIAKLAFPRCEIHPIHYRGEMDISALQKLTDVANRTKPDIIHIHSRRGADIWGAITAKLTGIPAICTRRVDNPESSWARYKYRQFNAVVSISQGVADVVRQHCNNEQLTPIIHSAVDLSEYAYSANRSWLNQHFNIPDDHAVIANFAQLIKRKGQAEIIRAVNEIVKQNKNVTCLLFGKGKLAAEYQQLIDTYALNKHIKLCGFTNEVARILPCIDIVLHPAHAEGLGVILLQAGACKRAVIASPSGGIPEIIKHNHTGLMVDAGSSTELAQATLGLLANHEHQKQLGAQLYKHVTDHFSINAMATQYLALYQRVSGKYCD